MSARWDTSGGGDSSQDYTQQATQEECVLDLDEYTQVETVPESNAEGGEDPNRVAEPVPWGRLMRLSGGGAVSLMPRPEQPQGRALNEVTLGRGKMCEVQVADQRVSSKHCRIYCEVVSGHLGGTEVYVEDMSANGTWINQDMRLVRGQRRLLHSGDEISLLNPFKNRKPSSASSAAERSGAEPGREEDDKEKLEAEAATFTFINLNRNRGASHGRAGSLSVAETLRAGTVPGVSSPVLRSSASGVAGIFGGARKVEDFYDVREMIGHGTSGEVRRAINRTTGKQVAVKVIETRKFALTPGLTPKELVQEAEMLKRVDHEYIIKLEDIFQTEQAVYLVMDLVGGGDLFDRIVKKGVYAEDLAQELLFRVLTAVDYLHSQDIVHRDLKPENILLVGRDNDVDVKITDFGLAKRANKEGLKTFCGTPQYFAPEVLKRRNTVLGVGRYGKEADMWSVGVILYILLSGTHPFHTTTLFDQISHANYSMNGEEWEHISGTAKDLVSKLLTESPDSRLTADQALAHPFITGRAAARSVAGGDATVGGATAAGAAGAAAATATAPAGPGAPALAMSELVQAGEKEGGGGGPAKAAAAAPGDDQHRDRGDGGGAEGDGPREAAAAVAVAAGGSSSSQDTDVSSTSGAEDASPASKEGFSPTEGGGGSAKAVPPSGSARSPKDGRSPKSAPSPRDTKPSSTSSSPPPRGTVSDLPPPQPREPMRGAGGGGGGGAVRGRKRAKKDGAGDKQKTPPPYSQLQVVRVNGSDQGSGGGAAFSQEASGGAGEGAAEACAGTNGPDSSPAPAWAGPAAFGDVRGGNRASEGKAAPRSRGKPTPSSARDGAVGSSGGRGKRKAKAGGGGAHAPPCPAADGATPGRPSSRHSPRRDGAGAGAGAGAVVAMSPRCLPAEDEIMEYSSDDSPVKGKRARVSRRGQEEAPAPAPAAAAAAAAAAPAARSKPAKAAGRAGRAAAKAAPVSPSSAAAGKRASRSKPGPLPPPQQQPQQQQQQREMSGVAKQMHLNFGDSGRLNLSKVGPLSRVGAGSAAGEREREGQQELESGDQAADAAAGGAAATLETDSVGGGAPAGSSSSSSGRPSSSVADGADAGKVGKDSSGGGKKQPKGGNKPQRTMTHLWKRAGAGRA